MNDQEILANILPQAEQAFHSYRALPQVSWADHMAICILKSDWLAERDARIRAETESAALNLASNRIAKTPYPDWIVKAEPGNHPLISAWLGGVQDAYNVVATMKQESDLKAIADQGADR